MVKAYKTKTQKKRALESILNKSMKLSPFVGMGAVISKADFDKISDIVNRGLKKLK
jgi:hypothetical protein